MWLEWPRAISSVGYLFASTTLSRKRTARSTVCRETRPIDPSRSGSAGARVDERGQVDRTEVAGLVGQERLFAARIRGPNRTQVGCRVVAVDLVDEDQAGIARLPRPLHDPLPDFADGVVAVRIVSDWLRRSPPRRSPSRARRLTGVRVDDDVELGRVLRSGQP